MHDKLFNNQERLNNINFRKWASEIGLSVGSLVECINGKLHLSSIQKDADEARSLGIRGTPAFKINDKLIYGACPYATFQKALDAELKGEGWRVANCEFVQ